MTTAVHQYEDKLLEFAYGELPAQEAAAIDAHVRSCPRCTESLGQLRAVRSAMQQLPFEAAPEAGLESLLAIAAQQAERNAKAAPQPWWKQLLKPRLMTSLASAGALLVVGVVAFRTSKDFNPDAASMALQAEAARDQGPREAKKEAEPVAVAPAAPAASAAPEPAPSPALGYGGKATEEGALNEVAKAPKLRPQAVKPSPKRASEKSALSDEDRAFDDLSTKDTRSDTPSKVSMLSKAKRGKDLSPKALREDYSNSGASRELAAEAPAGAANAPPPPPADGKQGTVADKADQSSWGLGTGANKGEQTVGGSLASGPGRRAPSAEPAKQKEQPESDAQERKPQVQASLPAQPASKKGAAPAPAPATSSLSFKSLQGNTTGGRGDEEVAQRKEAPVETERGSNLEAARSAAQRGDHAGEIRYSLAVLEAGATGADRLESLKRICDSYQALGQDEKADAYCDQVLREFPSSAAARSLAQQRNYQQRARPTEVKVPAAKKAAPAEKPVKTDPAY